MEVAEIDMAAKKSRTLIRVAVFISITSDVKVD
jgi:hypothetical protein